MRLRTAVLRVRLSLEAPSGYALDTRTFTQEKCVRDYDSCLCERTQRGSEPFWWASAKSGVGDPVRSCDVISLSLVVAIRAFYELAAY